MADRPDCIAHWSALEDPKPGSYAGSDEKFTLQARLGRHSGLTRIAVNHVRLPPGRRTSYPHAESVEDEFVFVLEGTPDVWIDGTLHRLTVGESVGFPAGTGICHTFINNTADEVRLLVVGEPNRAENRVRYPLNQDHEATRKDRWTDAPRHPLGPHDGKPDPAR